MEAEACWASPRAGCSEGLTLTLSPKQWQALSRGSVWVCAVGRWRSRQLWGHQQHRDAGKREPKKPTVAGEWGEECCLHLTFLRGFRVKRAWVQVLALPSLGGDLEQVRYLSWASVCSWINGGNSTCSRRVSVKRGGLSRAGPGVPASLPFFLLHTSSTLTCSWLSRHSSPASCALALLPGGWALSPPGKLLPSFQAAQAWPQASNPATQPCPTESTPLLCVLCASAWWPFLVSPEGCSPSESWAHSWHRCPAHCNWEQVNKRGRGNALWKCV